MRRTGPITFDPLRRLLSFPLLRARRDGPDASPTEDELLFELTGENPRNRLFGRFGEDDVRSRLARAGILEGLSILGYPDPLLVLECDDPADQRVHLFSGERKRDRLLLEVRLQACAFHPGRPIGPFTEESSFRMLIIHWLVLSDPDRPFTVRRPRLPGQQRPGLGLVSPCLSLLRDLARELLLDGILDVPDHFHTALFYSRTFRFLDPGVEGRFQAIARDLKGVPLALASEAIRDGCLVDAGTGNALPWTPAEQVMPVRGPLRRYLHSQSYKTARDAACGALRVAVDWDLYRRTIAENARSGKYP